MAHIRKTAPGSYQVRWQEPARDNMGRVIQRRWTHHKETYATRDEAQERCDELNAARHRASAVSAAEVRKAGDLPFGEYAAGWLDALDVRVTRGQLKERTRDDYRKLLHRYVLPKFGPQAIATITPRQAEEFLASLVHRASRQGDREPLSPATVKHAWSVFRRVLQYAMRHNAIQSNAADRVDFGANRATGDRERFEHHPLTATEVAELGAAVAGSSDAAREAGLPSYPIYGLMVHFLAYTGLRASENAGLELQDLELTERPDQGPKCIVHVRRTKDRKDGKWTTSTPKSKRSKRSVPLPPWLTLRMRDYLAEHPRRDEPTAHLWPSRKNGGGYRAKGERYAVPYDWTQPIAMGTFVDTILKPALEAVGLPASHPATKSQPAQRGVRLHDLRHSFAVMQLMGGTHFMQVSKWLGHSTFTLTLDTYGDWIPEEDGGASNNLPDPTFNAAQASSAPEGLTGSNVVPFRRRRSG